MSQSLPLHIAFHLVPYISPRDIARCQRVCRSWHATFTSPSLLSAALRTHFPRAYEVRTHAIQNPSTFSTISARYRALELGIPQQELHFSINKSRKDAYIWTFSSNLLVFQSSHYPEAILTLVYFDPTPGCRVVRSGKIKLKDHRKSVVRVKVCGNILVVDRSEERRDMNSSRSRYFSSTECYRLNYGGDEDEVKAVLMCTINTFEFVYIDYSHQILIDVSSRYYAAYSKSSLGVGRQLFVWDVATGEEVKVVPGEALGGMGLMVELILIGDKVVLVGNDKRNNNFRRWRHFQDCWGFLSHFRVFEILEPEGPQKDSVGGFVGRKKVECPKESNLLSTAFKVSGREGEEDQEAAIILWELEDATNTATAHHYTLATSPSPSSPINSPLTPTYQYRLDESDDLQHGLYIPIDAKKSSPFVVKSREPLSFNMEFTGRNEEFLDTRLMLYHLKIQSFYPSSDVPGVMELEWQTKLKDRKDNSKERKVHSADRNVSYLNVHGMDVAGDERMSAFLELSASGFMDLVVLVWDRPFEELSI